MSSIARHHAEWLSLVPVSGPFLSMPVLLQTFNAGLEPHDPEQMRLLRQAFAEWQASLEKRGADPAPHWQWIEFVLRQTLELDGPVLVAGQTISQTLQAEVPEHHELLRPDFAVMDPASGKARLLVRAYPPQQELTSYVAGATWKASPDTRMTELLHATNVRLGLVTNGEHWLLVDAAKGETTGYSSWYSGLWQEEPITLRAFRTLLSAGRFFGVPEDQTLEALLTKSASNQQEVTDQLGYQVRRAVEVLIHSLDRADQDAGRKLLADAPPEQLYESALTVMMRLVFLFCAEERELIPSKPFPVYEQNYAVSTISKQLRELADQQGEELLEFRFDAWPRLLAAFRAVFGGLRHDDVHIPAYGGSLFNPDRFPFLEGRKAGTSWREAEANPLPVDNRTVLHLLEALQLLQVKVPGGGPAEARRLSFRALDIEQIGHVYEGLLDHTAKRAAEPFLGLAGTRDKEPEVPLAQLEALLAKGEAELIEFLHDETGKSASALKKALLAEPDDQQLARFRTACQSNDALWRRVQPLAGLVRLDSFGYPVVIPQGSVFVTAGTDRRSSGTHYTPRSLTEPIVQYTLEPLVYVGPAEGLPKSEWKLKPAAELLELKICDMACGSGAFLVQAARYMAERLLEAWDAASQASPAAPGTTPAGAVSTGRAGESLLPADPAERKTYAMRIIAQRCLYGVDKNPLAAEMAKLSLWLLTLAKDKPFEFLDHSIRCGDSLVGLHSLDQLRHFSLKPDADDAVLFKGPLDGAVDEAIALRLALEDLPSNTVEDIERQERLLGEANQKIARLRCAADLLVAAEFWGDGAKDKQERVRHAAVQCGHYVEKGPTEEFEQVAEQERRGQAMFHWVLEFPEVSVKRGGFDGFMGNPPFMGGSKISGSIGHQFREHIVSCLAGNTPGNADLCAFFLLQAIGVSRRNSSLGFLATNTLSQGDTRDVGLSQLVVAGTEIVRAAPSITWPGTASLEVSEVWLFKGSWQGDRWLDGKHVPHITSAFTVPDGMHALPKPLKANEAGSFLGSKTTGMGFIMTPNEAGSLIDRDARNSEVLFPYMNGEEVNSHPEQQPVRWVINFFDWPLERCGATSSYAGPVASDYPDCLAIVREKVKPERDLNNRKVRRERWWQYGERAPALYEAVKTRDSVAVRSRIANMHSVVRLPTNMVFSEKLVVFPDSSFGVLQSSIHEAWARHYSSTLKKDMQYTPSECFVTFPFPVNMIDVDRIGEQYHQCRQMLMARHQEGLTATYNRFHDPEDSSIDHCALRDLHLEMDYAVAAAYGWTDLDLGHGFHGTKQGVRFTISEPARREVLQRLLKLNHERYAEEVRQGLHDKKGKAKKPAAGRKRKESPRKPQPLFADEDDEGG